MKQTSWQICRPSKASRSRVGVSYVHLNWNAQNNEILFWPGSGCPSNKSLTVLFPDFNRVLAFGRTGVVIIHSLNTFLYHIIFVVWEPKRQVRSRVLQFSGFHRSLLILFTHEVGGSSFLFRSNITDHVLCRPSYWANYCLSIEGWFRWIKRLQLKAISCVVFQWFRVTVISLIVLWTRFSKDRKRRSNTGCFKFWFLQIAYRTYKPIVFNPKLDYFEIPMKHLTYFAGECMALQGSHEQSCQ